jgi:phosphoribosylformylglycinamidine synthase
MIFYFPADHRVYVVDSQATLNAQDIVKLKWLFRSQDIPTLVQVGGFYLGPRREMITPWSTNAVEITRNMGISGIFRIEELIPCSGTEAPHDRMLQVVYEDPGQEIFEIGHKPEPIQYINDITAYNEQEGLALSPEEVSYLEDVSVQIGRPLTDSEVFGFSQVNSEHCRHKIFNGVFIIDGAEMPESLFSLIKKTSKENPNAIVSAYKDNVAFLEGPHILQFAPQSQDRPDYFSLKPIDSIISIKAETHNFPTTVEPFNGAATGSGGEIRDRMAGGSGSIPLAGTAVYMTSYPRLEADRPWEKNLKERPWLYHDPADILIKASNGASDYGNKFGQPLICGSILTFEQEQAERFYGFDKVIMLAGGIGFANSRDAQKSTPQIGDKIVVLGGDNYRIGMGGGAVSSVATGEYGNAIELNAVQRSNPEMQKRAYNVTRAFAESDANPVVSIHDHGAGGHLNCISELVEATGGKVNINALPVGDPTLSAREIIGNESQERMGLIIAEKNVPLLMRLAGRERAPAYVVGEVTGDMRFSFVDKDGGKALDLELAHLFGKPPKTVLKDVSMDNARLPIAYDKNRINQYIEDLLQMESVACKDWLTNKVDRSVTGRVAMQQCAGSLQLPLNNLGISALDYQGITGIATSIGHAPGAMLVDEVKGAQLSIAEALTNIVWVPLAKGLKSVSLSANWMWPAKNRGENARLYRAVEAVSQTAINLGINIPTGKDSLSMTQKYPDGSLVYSPGTVIISAAAEVSDLRRAVSPALSDTDCDILYVPFGRSSFALGGSSFAQLLCTTGMEVPGIDHPESAVETFESVQDFLRRGLILAGHDIGSGGLITSLLEMCFSNNSSGMEINLGNIATQADLVSILFSERAGLIIQTNQPTIIIDELKRKNLEVFHLGFTTKQRSLKISHPEGDLDLDIDSLRDLWFKSSYLLDRRQTHPTLALERFANYKKQERKFVFPAEFKGSFEAWNLNPVRSSASGIKAAIIREKGVNGDREMAWSLYAAGFDVKDVHMTDLIEGRETLEDIQMIVFVGGFSNSDVLGSAKGWAGAFLFNPKAKAALDRFYERQDTLSLGVCNGCQLMVELGLLTPEHEDKPRMTHNASGKFESSFLTVEIQKNNTVMLGSLSGARLGVWVAHGEGRFTLPYREKKYQIPAKYTYSAYPGNPNGSDFDAACLASSDGRHLAIMPHIERSLHPWQWPYYPGDKKHEDVSPWIVAFVNAREWIREKTGNA